MEFLIFNFFIFIVELLYEKLTQGNDTQRNNPHNVNCDNLNEEICISEMRKQWVSFFMFISRYLYANNFDSVCVFLN